jgi:hypothetical protein
MADNEQCREAPRAKELGSVGKLLAEFVTKTAGWLHERGREVVFWGEYPLKIGDLQSLPPFLINGEVYAPQFDALYKKHGIRQTIYAATQGEERHFPMYYPLEAERRLHPAGRSGRGGSKVAQLFRNYSTNAARKNAELIGVVNAGWADSGLHAETFWLGYAAGTSAAWKPNTPEPEEATENFYKLFYGWNAVEMDKIYRLMSHQTQFWNDSWETGPSKSRKGIWGNSNRIYNPRQDARDQFIPLPPVPESGLKYDSKWAAENAKRLELAASYVPESDELIGLIEKNLKQAEYNRYNLEVMLELARLTRHNLAMLAAMGKVDGLLGTAGDAAGKNQPKQAVAAVDEALRVVRGIKEERNRVLKSLTEVWNKTWYPRVPEANGRKFLHELDDVKDHIGDRTVDLSYMMQREYLLPVGEWAEKVRTARNEYAKAHRLSMNREAVGW